MTIFLEVSNNPKDIHAFVENPLSLPYRVIRTDVILESEQVVIELNWLSSDNDVIPEFLYLSDIRDVHNVIKSKAIKWNQNT